MNSENIREFKETMAAAKVQPAAEQKRIYRRLLRAIREVERPQRMTRSGHALLPVFKDGRNQGGSVAYQLTPREVKRRKNVRRQQRANRRANRQ